MTGQALISVMAPIYSTMAKRKRCPDCLVSQTAADIEIIVVNAAKKRQVGAAGCFDVLAMPKA